MVDLHAPTPVFHGNEPHFKKSRKLYQELFEEEKMKFQFDLEPE